MEDGTYRRFTIYGKNWLKRIVLAEETEWDGTEIGKKNIKSIISIFKSIFHFALTCPYYKL